MVFCFISDQDCMELDLIDENSKVTDNDSIWDILNEDSFDEPPEIPKIDGNSAELEPEKALPSVTVKKNKKSHKRKKPSKYSEELHDVLPSPHENKISEIITIRDDSMIVVQNKSRKNRVTYLEKDPDEELNEDLDEELDEDLEKDLDEDFEVEEISEEDDDDDWNSEPKAKQKKVSNINKTSKVKSATPHHKVKTKHANKNVNRPSTSKQKGKTSKKKENPPQMLIKGDVVWYVGKRGKSSFIKVLDEELDDPFLLNGQQLKIDLYVATSENSNHKTKEKKWISRCAPVGIPLDEKGGKLIGHELFRKFEKFNDEEKVKANFKKHLITEDYQNLLKKFEIVKRVNLEIYDPDEKLEYLTGAKKFKDDEDCEAANNDSSNLIEEEKTVNLPPESSAISSSSEV